MPGGLAQALLGGLVGVVLHLVVVSIYRLLRHHWRLLLVIWAVLHSLDWFATRSAEDSPSTTVPSELRRGVECL